MYAMEILSGRCQHDGASRRDGQIVLSSAPLCRWAPPLQVTKKIRIPSEGFARASRSSQLLSGASSWQNIHLSAMGFGPLRGKTNTLVSWDLDLSKVGCTPNDLTLAPLLYVSSG